MTTGKLELVPVQDDETWDRLNADSPQGSVFTSAAFLDAVCPGAARWLMLEDGDVLGGVPILMQDGTPAPAPYLYTPYHGPLFTSALAAQPLHRRVPRTVSLSSALLDALSARYPAFALSLHPSLHDVRGFQWFNYGEVSGPKPSVCVRYTGVVELDDAATLENYLTHVRKVRRYEYTRAVRSGLRVRRSDDVSILLELLGDTFLRQGVGLDAREREATERICARFLGTGRAHLTVAEDGDGMVVGATLFLDHAGTTYYLMGATRTEARDAGANTVLFVEAVKDALARGVRRVDCVGINSPNRGDFKTSLGAVPVPYFVVSVS